LSVTGFQFDAPVFGFEAGGEIGLVIEHPDLRRRDMLLRTGCDDGTEFGVNLRLELATRGEVVAGQLNCLIINATAHDKFRRFRSLTTAFSHDAPDWHGATL
jgi:hypothetical protein